MARSTKNKKKLSLHYGYADEVLQLLSNQGITVKRQVVYDIVNGRKKDSDSTIKVWEAIRKVVNQHKRFKAKAQKIKTNV